MSLSNKPREVMGLDTLANNIISAKFSNDGDKFSGANEFISINQGPNPEMGLNLQSSRA